MQSNEYIETCLINMSLFINFIVESWHHVFYGQEI